MIHKGMLNVPLLIFWAHHVCASYLRCLFFYFLFLMIFLKIWIIVWFSSRWQIHIVYLVMIVFYTYTYSSTHLRRTPSLRWDSAQDGMNQISLVVLISLCWEFFKNQWCWCSKYAPSSWSERAFIVLYKCMYGSPLLFLLQHSSIH